MKICTKCNENKDLSCFRPDKRMRSGLQSHCKDCHQREVNAWKAANRERSREHNRNSYYRRNGPEAAQKRRSYNKNNSLKIRETHLRKSFGISLQDYSKMLDEQKGLCKICQSHHSTVRKNFAVDHCHQTNKIRGLLCDACNKGIGLLRDDPNICRAAAMYIETAR